MKQNTAFSMPSYCFRFFNLCRLNLNHFHPSGRIFGGKLLQQHNCNLTFRRKQFLVQIFCWCMEYRLREFSFLLFFKRHEIGSVFVLYVLHFGQKFIFELCHVIYILFFNQIVLSESGKLLKRLAIFVVVSFVLVFLVFRTGMS